MLFVYLTEAHPIYGKRVKHIKQQMNVRGDTLFTSTLAAAEVLVGPTKTGDTVGFNNVDAFFRGPSVKLLPFSEQAISHFSTVRAKYSVRPPDAIHLACAAVEGIDVFITNDDRLVGLKVPGIQFIVGIDTNLF